MALIKNANATNFFFMALSFNPTPLIGAFVCLIHLKRKGLTGV
jgi:hypothetical protein